MRRSEGGGESQDPAGSTRHCSGGGRALDRRWSDRDLAALSVVAFRDLINPALKEAYASGQGTFVDVTAATDAYVPFEQTTNLPPYGDIPVAVATVCRITYYCELRDIHAKPEGYQIEAELIAATLPEIKKKNKK